MLATHQPVSWLTQESHDRLKAELKSLSNARGKGMGDMGPAAVENRIRQLISLLRNARVHSPDDDGVVEPGMLIEAKIAGQIERFLMGSREISGHGEVQVFSERSPLGAAIYGKKSGDTTHYSAPNGKMIEVVILSAKPFILEEVGGAAEGS